MTEGCHNADSVRRPDGSTKIGLSRLGNGVFNVRRLLFCSVPVHKKIVSSLSVDDVWKWSSRRFLSDIKLFVDDLRICRRPYDPASDFHSSQRTLTHSVTV